jgi:hypothetical protein
MMSLPAPLSTPALAALDTDSIRDLAKQHLIDQLGLSAEAGRIAQGELKRLGAWIAGSEFERPMDIEIDRSCGHTVRLLGAIARPQSAQAIERAGACPARRARHGAAHRRRARGLRGEGVREI